MTKNIAQVQMEICRSYCSRPGEYIDDELTFQKACINCPLEVYVAEWNLEKEKADGMSEVREEAQIKGKRHDRIWPGLLRKAVQEKKKKRP